MQVNNVNIYNNNKLVKRNQSTSFRGIGSTLGNINLAAMKKLEKGGFFAEFVLLDLVGLVLPRVYQGFQRNKEELGHLNYQAGTEEFLREALTGPSLFLIPIGMVIAAGKSLGKAVQINSKVFSKFTETFKNIDSELINKDQIESQKAFATKLFEKLYKNHPDVGEQAYKNAETLYKGQFVDGLINSLSQKGQDLKKSASNFSDLISTINVALFPTKKNAFGVDIINEQKTFVTSAADLFEDSRKYMQDVIPSVKLTVADSIEGNKSTLKDLFETTIDKIGKIRGNGRRLMCVGGAAALAAFLSIIPKIYQRSKTNPALAGLVKEEGKEAKKC